MSLDRSKLKELENNKVINISYKDEYEDVLSYEFVFHDDKVFMNSSSSGEIYIADINEIDNNDIINYKDIKRWYRRFAMNILDYIMEENRQDADTFREWYEYEYKLFIGLAERDEEGDIVGWISDGDYKYVLNRYI